MLSDAAKQKLERIGELRAGIELFEAELEQLLVGERIEISGTPIVVVDDPPMRRGRPPKAEKEKTSRRGASPETIQQVIELRRGGMGLAPIAYKLGISQTAVHNILKREGMTGTKEKRATPEAKAKGEDLSGGIAAHYKTRKLFTKEDYAKVREAHFEYGIKVSQLGWQWQKYGATEVQKAIDSANYDEYTG